MRTDARHSTRNIPTWLALAAAFLLVLRLGNMGWRLNHPASHASHPGHPNLVKWVDHDQALETAKATGKPILYDFTAEWCGPCGMMSRQVFNDKESAAGINRDFIPVSVTDRSREDGRNPEWVTRLQEKYSINAFPTLIVDSGGVPAVSRGYGGKEGTLKFLRESRKEVP